MGIWTQVRFNTLILRVQTDTVIVPQELNVLQFLLELMQQSNDLTEPWSSTNLHPLK